MRKITRISLLAICLTIVCCTKVYGDTDSDMLYLAQCVEAEASNQGLLGKRYIVDCILNRLDSKGYKTYSEVINEPGQFSCVRNNKIYATPTNETWMAIYIELDKRTDYEIKYFRTNSYHGFGTPCFQYKDHYFSK